MRIGDVTNGSSGFTERRASLSEALPSSPHLRRLTDAKELWRQGKFAEAASIFQRRLDADGPMDAYIGLVRCCTQLAAYDEALEVLGRALTKWPEDPVLHARRGFVLDELGRRGDATEEYVQADHGYHEKATDTTDPDFVQQYGILLSRLGRKADARECYKRAKSLFESSGGINSNDPDLVSGLAFVLDELDLHSEALLAYDRVIAMRPGDLVALFNKALILDNSGRYADAEAAYRATLARFPDDPDCNAGLGHALGKLERYVEAEIYCRKALNKQETHSDAHEALGFALQSLGRYKDAELEYRASLGIAPNAPDTLNNLAHLLNEAGRPEEAQAYVVRALETKRTWQSLGTQAAIEVKLADKFHDDELYRDVIDHVKEALMMLPTDLTISERDYAGRLYVNLASAEASLGNFSSAKKAYRRAIQEAPTNSVVGQKAARNLRRLHDALRSTVRVPRWLAWPISAGAVVGIIYGLLVQHLSLDSAGFVGFVMGMFFVIFAAFSLAAITKLKMGPAEFETAAGIPTVPQLEKA